MADNSGTGYQRGTTAAPIRGYTNPYFEFSGQAPGPSAPTVAAVSTNFGSNADLKFTNVNADNNVVANQVMVKYVVAGNSTPLSVSVAGSTITVNVATSSGGAATSTGSDVMAAINGNTAAAALVTASLAVGSSGAGVVAAGTFQLTGGLARQGLVGNQPRPRIPPIHNVYA